MKNLIIVSKSFGEHKILVDDEDFDYINGLNWLIKKQGNTFYAEDWKEGLMHRFILGINDPKIFVDHKDHNGLNNQKSNIRICSHEQNIRNRTSYGKSKYLGVTASGNNWIARICHNKKNHNLGTFKNEEDAARKYDEYALMYHGEFANLNFK